MIPYERRQILLNELEKQDMVTLSDFARALHGVSESTIRRDLKILEGEGQIVLLRGGAAKIKTGSYDKCHGCPQHLGNRYSCNHDWRGCIKIHSIHCGQHNG